MKIQKETGIPVMPHLSCRDRNRIAIRSGVLGAHINDIRNILIVTGDPVGREEREFTKSVFDFNSIRLMQFMSSLNEEIFRGDEMYFGGALNQNGAAPEKIAERMKKKIDAGCQFFLTQPVYSEEEMDRLCHLQNKTGAKILIGVMPLVSYRNALFIKNEMPGIYVPDDVLSRYSPEGNREEWEETAEEISRQMISLGKDVGAGYYLMTPFHRVSLIKKILEHPLLQAEK
ncbi:MAG: methylenetetrahydrofolate reductase [Clostridiales bacterium]|nr:methylenetetrahydrofolate reductase [Clostridiales bacterium]